MQNKIDYIYYEEIDSTNLCLRRLMESNICEYTVVSADTQTAGKGRRGHSWESPKGSSISTSMILFPDKSNYKRLSQITLLAGLSVCNAIEKHTDLKPMIKWPNDVLINEKKVCGILVENITSQENNNALIVGIGINVHSQDFPEELKEKATSIDIETNVSVKRNELITCLWEEFISYYEYFLRGPVCDIITGEFSERLINLGREVEVIKGGEHIKGLCLGVNDKGELLVKTDNDTLTIDFGEVSVRGIYGYV